MDRFEKNLVALLPRLRRFARSLTKDAVEADDLCQAVIEKALKNRKQKRSDGKLRRWLFMIARNHWLDEMRKIQRVDARMVPMGQEEEALAAIGPNSADQDNAITVHQMLQALPNEQREAAALVWVEGYAYREAANMLEIPIGTLTSRLSRARSRLAKQLGDS